MRKKKSIKEVFLYTESQNDDDDVDAEQLSFFLFASCLSILMFSKQSAFDVG